MGSRVKLSRRTRKNQKIKVRKEDIPFLLAKYQYHEGRSQTSLTLVITFIFLLITVVFSVATVAPSFSLSSFNIVFLLIGILIILYVIAFVYYSRKSSEIAEILKMDKHMKRYLKKK